MFSFYSVSCTRGKSYPEKVNAFCSELKGSHITIRGCHWKGFIRMDLGDSRSGTMKPMIVWAINADKGDINLYNVAQKKLNPNPIATQRDQLRANPEEMSEYLKRKKQQDTAVSMTKAISGRSKLNSSFDKNCKWYQLKEPEGNPNPMGRYDDVCINKFDIKIAKAYKEFSDSIKKVDEKYFPIALEGLPILNWRLPFQKEDGWLESEHLPQVFVTGTEKQTSSTAMHRTDFKYYFKEMPFVDLNFSPQWAKK